ncbi:MAG TPA: porin [Steroidobacteraceae bacterium]|nr:porin [Steroidobacteraceae bacterium]
MLLRARIAAAAPLACAATGALLLSHLPLARAGGAAPASAQSSTQSTDDEIRALEQRLKADERRLRALERRRRPRGPEHSAVAQWGSKGFGIASADDANVLNLGALIQADGRYFANSNAPSTADTWLLRRVQPILRGTIDHIYDFKLMPDFGGGKVIVQDAYIAGRFRSWLTLTVGKFKPPVGLERLQAVAATRFIERGLPTDLVPNRDIGFQLAGALSAGRISYALGLFNGVADGTSSDSNPTPDFSSDGKGDLAARILLQPFLGSGNRAVSGLQFGIAATYTHAKGSPAAPLLAPYKTTSQQTFFSYRGNTAVTSTQPALNDGTYASGERLRIAPQLYYSVRSVGLLGEYTQVHQGVARDIGAVSRSALLTNSAWQMQLSWFITRERESLEKVSPKKDFRLGAPGWGAFELVVRAEGLSVDRQAFTGGADSFSNPTASAERVRAAGIAVNWYLNRNLKWVLNYELTRFKGGAPSADRPDEKALFTRFQLAF